MKRSLLLISLLLAASAGSAFADSPAKDADKAPAAPADAASTKPQSAVSHGSVTVGGTTVNYTATAGTLILKNDDDKPIASMSYVAYTKDGVSNPNSRPITFLYNGGPGSSTIWLHMLAFGPQRVEVGNGTLTPHAPYKLVNNEDSLLDASDLVFIDAPGTGFGRVLDKDHGGEGTPKDVYGIDEDAKSFAKFITQYLTDNNRWNSPKFLFGESYGTTRSAVLANMLETDDDVSLNGVILLSAILNLEHQRGLPAGRPRHQHLLCPRPAELRRHGVLP